ncbi:hypothetical protein V5F79_24875 [Xanthobacter flavus]|uniref:hypothetical protein n=1 Tax=Xanthobacter flavus TaxID=281 RepID=UPI003728CEC6
MTGNVELMAARMGWVAARNYVIVEGTSDVAYLTRASKLHELERGCPLLDADLAVVASGRGDDGGVDGVNRRLIFYRQLAEMDASGTGAWQHRFIGLLDNDMAGRSAFTIASSFDRRIEPYVDIFLLHPVMPVFPLGYDRAMEIARVNRPFRGLDWEVEDLCSERILRLFEAQYTGGVQVKNGIGGKIHRELHPDFKPELRKIFIEEATLADAGGFVELLRMLRIYLSLPHDFVQL